MQILTWGELVMYVLAAGFIWYGYVLFVYRKHWQQIRKKRSGSQVVKWNRQEENISAATSPNTAPVFDAHANEKPVHVEVHELMKELELVFAEAIKEQLATEQILAAISFRLNKYTSLPGPIKDSIIQHIVNEFFLQLQITINADDIISLWKSYATPVKQEKQVRG